MRPLPFSLSLVVVGTLLSGCVGATAPSAGNSPGTPSPGGKLRLEFWHTRRGGQEKLLGEICQEYNQQNPSVEVVPAFQGSYDDLNKKVRASLQAKSLPALAVGYENNVLEYMANGAIAPLDPLVADAEVGLKAEELADIPEAYLSANRYPQFKNQLLSFPFTKSNLVLYYNAELLKKAGFSAPPATWTEFEAQSAAVTKLTGQPAYAFTPDPSTLDGLIFTFGGEVYDSASGKTQFNQPATVKMLEMLQRMAKAKTLALSLADEVPGLFLAQRRAFVIDSSSTRELTEEQVGNRFAWDLTVPPHAEGEKPTTVMYGPNVCVFKSTPQQEREAWKFIRYFTSPEVTGRWARGTGYLPIRMSVAELPEMKTFYEKTPRAKHVLDVLPHARPEPNPLGWGEVRSLLTEAARSVVAGSGEPQAVAATLKEKADRALAGSR